MKLKSILAMLTFVFIGTLCINVIAEEESSQTERSTYEFLPGEENEKYDKDTSQLEEDNASVADNSLEGLLPGEETDYKDTGQLRSDKEQTPDEIGDPERLPGEQTEQSYKATGRLENDATETKDKSAYQPLPGEETEDYDKKTGRLKDEDDNKIRTNTATYQPLPGEK